MPNSNRKKLKPKRFDKFIQSEGRPPESSVASEQEKIQLATKRRQNESLEFSANKKICYGLMHPPSAIRNLANSRLNKLKQSLQNESKPSTNSEAGTSSAASPPNTPVPNNSANKTFSTPNLANSRLDKIKQNIHNGINSPMDSSKSSKSSNNLPQNSPNSNNTRLKTALNLNPVVSKQNTSNRINQSGISPSNLANGRMTRLKRMLIEAKAMNENNNNSTESNLESITKNQNSHSPVLVPIDEFIRNDDSYKMALTASWIRNHDFDDVKERESSSDINDSFNCSNTALYQSSSERLANLDTSEEMEWTNAEPEVIRNGNNLEMAPQPQEKKEVPVPSEPAKIEKEKYLSIVVDTNIFIKDLAKIKDIVFLRQDGPVQPLIYIPWMVVNELDELKDRSKNGDLKTKAFEAIKFINQMLNEKNPRVKGQSVADMAFQKCIGSSPDDKIIATCLQALEKYEDVIVLSNDLNLKNKAMINNLTPSSANEIIMKITSKLRKTDKTRKIKSKMSVLCSMIICECAQEAYGDVWTKMNLLSNPPWSLLDCLIRFKEYWVAVFQEKLLKHFMLNVEKLKKLLVEDNAIFDDSELYTELVKLCLNICIFLKDIEEHKGSVENTIKIITEIA
ncbi:unnamed protein product [Phyllotreta striolata]|uniref:PIN domain-containing protein n=1 Tax=Phyllotreta striolata TaxID=444603 RepID=A0A9N9TG12_PHYSR|nr:unnamed protein product [Phyllotreta striolata]